LVSALLAAAGRADEAAPPLDAAAMAALGIARPVRPEAGPWSWTTGNYAYDASGNITAIGLQSFAYDTRGRLVDATLVRPDQPGSEHETFAYDAFGNMTSRTGASAYSVATPASLATNHLVGATYDGAGNVTLLTPPGQAYQYEYTYDALGSLNQARAANVAGETRQFSIYTADDERIWTYDLGVNTSHWKIRDLGGRVLRDYVVTGDTWQLSRDYVYRGEQLLAAVTPAETLTFSLDHLGTPRVITRADRTLAGFHQYLPYGEEWTNGTGVQEGEPKKFTSHERDRDPSGAGTNELDYMHARFYSGRVGRFLSVDPVLGDPGVPQSWNRYAYVQNNPIRYTDPTGKSLWEELIRVVRYIGRDEKVVARISEISKNKTMTRIEEAIKVAREEKGAKIAVVTETKEARNAVGKQLAESGKIRPPERSGIWPEHVNPADGPNADIHVQTLGDTKSAGFGTSLGIGILAIVGANTMAANANKDATPGEVMGAFAWDAAKAIDPFFITDVVEHFSGIGNYSEESPPE
jgi:RHS repeat-associated protein